MRTQRWRYTERGPHGKYGAELYDRWNDLKEWVNAALSLSEKEVVSEMKKPLHQRVAHTKSKSQLWQQHPTHQPASSRVLKPVGRGNLDATRVQIAFAPVVYLGGKLEDFLCGVAYAS